MLGLTFGRASQCAGACIAECRARAVSQNRSVAVKGWFPQLTQDYFERATGSASRQRPAAAAGASQRHCVWNVSSLSAIPTWMDAFAPALAGSGTSMCADQPVPARVSHVIVTPSGAVQPVVNGSTRKSSGAANAGLSIKTRMASACGSFLRLASGALHEGAAACSWSGTSASMINFLPSAERVNYTVGFSSRVSYGE